MCDKSGHNNEIRHAEINRVAIILHIMFLFVAEVCDFVQDLLGNMPLDKLIFDQVAE